MTAETLEELRGLKVKFQEARQRLDRLSGGLVPDRILKEMKSGVVALEARAGYAVTLGEIELRTHQAKTAAASR